MQFNKIVKLTSTIIELIKVVLKNIWFKQKENKQKHETQM